MLPSSFLLHDGGLRDAESALPDIGTSIASNGDFPMLYIKLAKDNLERLLTRLEFGTCEPHFDPLLFGGSPRVRLIPADTIQHDRAVLVLEKQMGSWCFLNLDEFAVYRSLDGRELDEISDELPAANRPQLQEFVIQLYWLGLLELNGRRFFESDLYADGPIAVSSPLFLIVPTERCNLTCSYCFASSGPSEQNQLDWAIARRIVDLIAESPSRYATIEFAGGEPFLETALMQQFVIYARRRIQENDKHVRFIAQTNGTLITPAVLDIIEEFGISIGLSLDGGPTINDHARVFPGGKGAYETTVKALRLMQRRGLHFGVLCVVTKNSCTRLDEILEHFEELGLRNVKLNPVFKLGRAQYGWDALAVEPGEYLEAHKAYLNYVTRAQSPVIEENTTYLLENLATKMHPYRCMRSQCGAGSDFLTFTAEGDVYPCSRYRTHPELRLGSVAELGGLDGAWRANPVMVKLTNRRVETIPECEKCLYKRFCEAGCPLDSYSHFSTVSAPHPWCEYYKGIYAELFRRISVAPDMVGTLSPRINTYHRSFFGNQV